MLINVPAMDTTEEYYANTGRLAKKAAERKAKKGGHVGRPPLGYRAAAVGRKRVIVPDEAKASLVREAFALRAKGMTLQEIIDALTPKGLVSRSGKPLRPSSLHLVLNNPVYRGYVRYEGLIMEGSHVSLVGPNATTGQSLRQRNSSGR
jgi:site-specific DNA recombinase